MKNTASWYTYMVRCSDHSLYTGIAKDLDKRIAAHNDGSGAKYTRSRRPVRLVYKEEHPNRSEASKREYQIKKMGSVAKKALILSL